MDAPTDTDADGKERIDTADEYPEPVTATLEGIYGHVEAGRERTHATMTVRSEPGDPTIAATLMMDTPTFDFGLSMTADEAREIGAALIDSAEQSDEVVVDHDFEL